MGALRKFQPILEDARKRDVNESDTVTIVKDLLTELFGYDKYAEITTEYAIKSTFVDVAIKMGDEVQLLIEVKSINTVLDERHLRQAVNYAANEGVEWVVLTNGVDWRVYRVTFTRPINQELVMDVNLLQLNTRRKAEADQLWPLCKRGVLKSALEEYHTQKKATSRYILGAIILSEPVLKSIRTEVRRVSDGLMIDLQELEEKLRHEVIKRDVLDGDSATEAAKKVRKASKRTLRATAPATKDTVSGDADDGPVAIATSAADSDAT